MAFLFSSEGMTRVSRERQSYNTRSPCQQSASSKDNYVSKKKEEVSEQRERAPRSTRGGQEEKQKEKREDKGRPEVRAPSLLSASWRVHSPGECCQSQASRYEKKGAFPHPQYSSLCNPPTQIMQTKTNRMKQKKTHFMFRGCQHISFYQVLLKSSLAPTESLKVQCLFMKIIANGSSRTRELCSKITLSKRCQKHFFLKQPYS